jgi:hypothetical protein
MDRLKKIEHARQTQPLAELRRKWEKSRGRHSNARWSQEAVDLVYAEGRELMKNIRQE